MHFNKYFIIPKSLRLQITIIISKRNFVNKIRLIKRLQDIFVNTTAMRESAVFDNFNILLNSLDGNSIFVGVKF